MPKTKHELSAGSLRVSLVGNRPTYSFKNLINLSCKSSWSYEKVPNKANSVILCAGPHQDHLYPSSFVSKKNKNKPNGSDG